MLYDLDGGTVEKGPLDDVRLELRPEDDVVDEVVLDADGTVLRRKSDGRDAVERRVGLVDLRPVVVGQQEELVRHQKA